MPKPQWSWTTRGMTTPDPPTQADLESSRHKRMAGFVFRGTGWYGGIHVCVVLAVPGGFHVHFYDRDPRLALIDIAQMMERTP